jgi:flagellin-specific chaperone FliS
MKLSKKIKIFRSLFNHLNCKNGESIWSDSMVLFISAIFTLDECKAIAKKLGSRYPYFAKRLADNFGYDLIEFIM